MAKLSLSAVGLILFWTVATLSFGGVAPLFSRAYPLVAALVGLAAWSRFRRQNHPSDSWPEARQILWILGSLFLLALSQVLPCPQFLLQYLSPLSTRLTFDTLRALALEPRRLGYPISIDPSATWSFVGQFLAFLLILAASFTLTRRIESKRALASALLFVSSGIALFGLVHRFSGSEEMYWRFHKGVTFFGPYVSKNHAGALFAVSAALAIGLWARPLSPSRRYLLGLGLSLNVLALLFTGSRAAVIALGVPLILMATTHANRQLLLTLVAVIGTAIAWKATVFSRLLSTAEAWQAGTEFRVRFWQYALELFAKSPLAGIGFGAFAKGSPMLASRDMWLHPEHAENEFLELLACGGTIAAILCAAIGIPLVRNSLRKLRDPGGSKTEKAFVLALVALAVDSFFVFHAPLPAHQILLALLLAGAFASERHHLLADRMIRRMFFAALLVGSLCTVSQFWSRAIPTRSLKERLIQNPTDATALYEAGSLFAELGDARRATVAGIRAEEIAPFDLAPRLRFVRTLARVNPDAATPFVDRLIAEPIPVGPEIRSQWITLSAEAAFRRGDSERVRERLHLLKRQQPADWRIPMIRSAIEPVASESIVASWDQAHAIGVAPDLWDFTLAGFLYRPEQRPLLKDVAQKVGNGRSDIGLFLDRLAPIDPTLSVMLDRGKSSPRFRPNSQGTAANLVWLSPEVVEVRVKSAQSAIDALLLPVEIQPLPSSLSFRVWLSSDIRDLPARAVLESAGKIFVSDTPAQKDQSGRWRLELRGLPEGLQKITGVGFTPFERAGRYEVGPVEAYVE